MTIQEAIVEFVIPRIETKVKNSVVLGDNQGKAILTGLNIPMSVNPAQVAFTMKFYYSYAEEWITVLTKLAKDLDKYPFLFINARGVIYEGDVVTIPEMVIATRTSPEWYAGNRDAFTMCPILANLTYFLEESLNTFFGTDGELSLRVEMVYNSKLVSKSVTETIDAVLITNTKLRILKQCEND